MEAAPSTHEPLTPAQSRLVANNLGLVGLLIKKHFSQQMEILKRKGGAVTQEDVFQTGVLALMHASRKWVRAKGTFGTYADQWVKKYVGEYLHQVVPTVQLPQWTLETKRLDEHTAQCVQRARDSITVAEYPSVPQCSTRTDRPPVLRYLYGLPVHTRHEQLGRMIAIKLFGLDSRSGSDKASARQSMFGEVANGMGLPLEEAQESWRAFRELMLAHPFRTACPPQQP